ncbi:bromodomain-containing protein [Hamiltosporidium magnivora]|uniref:Bromodomain-containing protein n=1 Tax=Hamiltosporidium magnivora TaxID=148818 RepID=A0A4Q9LJY1_9MICR|nr:bromodomain-containing protein [Hamiltosporidium magnivora]
MTDNTIPREEKKYKSIYKDLDVKRSLKVIWTNKCKKNEENKYYVSDRSKKSVCIKTKQEMAKKLEENNTFDFSCIHYAADKSDVNFIKENIFNVNLDIFELIMDRLEKEWFFFQQNLVNKVYVPTEYAAHVCNICGKSDSKVGNDTIFCDGCDICVHQECYGLPYIPEGTWLCRLCLFSKKRTPSCKYCTKIGGALKQTADNRWAHILCANWIPSLSFVNTVFLEPIEEIGDELRKYKNSFCIICEQRRGVTIRCTHMNCDISYHVTCGMEANYYFDQANFISYCKNHDPRKILSLFSFGKYRQSLYPDLKNIPDIRPHVLLSLPKPSFIIKVKEMKPILCNHFIDRILSNDLCNIEIETKTVETIGMWWMLKRSFIRRIPLISFLNFEYGSDFGHEWFKNRKLFCYNRFSLDYYKSKGVFYLNDMDLDEEKSEGEIKNKTITDNQDLNCKENESEGFVNSNVKYECQHKAGYEMKEETLKEICDSVVILKELLYNLKEYYHTRSDLTQHNLNLFEMYKNPEKYYMKEFLLKLREVTDFFWFEEPVTEIIAPKYFTIIKNPMDFFTIEKKINEDENYKYKLFLKDLKLIYDNCKIYNKNEVYFQKLLCQFDSVVNELNLKYKEIIYEKISLKSLLEYLKFK